MVPSKVQLRTVMFLTPALDYNLAVASDFDRLLFAEGIGMIFLGGFTTSLLVVTTLRYRKS